MFVRICRSVAVAAAAVTLFVTPALAQRPVSMGDTVSATFTIEAIDHATRIVTLKGEDGTYDDVYCGPEVQRFDALKAEIERVFAAMTVDEITRALEPHNVPCGRVRDMRQAIEHPQVEPRGTLLSQTHPQMGVVQTLGPVAKLSRTPAEPRLPPPLLGEHTREVLADLST